MLFDLANDPLENENLAQKMPNEVTRLRKWLPIRDSSVAA
jgi:hypothetical protein